jgi:hypothetical protein
LHDDVVSLSHRYPEFIDRHRLDVLTIGRHHGHFQARDAHVENCRRRAIDHPQAHALARAKFHRMVEMPLANVAAPETSKVGRMAWQRVGRDSCKNIQILM